MSNPSGRKGTDGEKDVVRYLQTNGYPTADRRVQAGAKDKGDIINGPAGVTIEVKACRKMELAKWVQEAEVEAVNAGTPVGVVWHKRIGTKDAGKWYVTMTGRDFLDLCEQRFL